jgi:hypothetical protein
MSHCKDPVHSKTVAKLEFQGASYHVIVRDNHRHDFFARKATASVNSSIIHSELQITRSAGFPSRSVAPHHFY